MLFLRYYNNTLLIKAKATNGFYIISKITKEVDNMSFGTLVNKPSIIKEDNTLEISPFTISSL